MTDPELTPTAELPVSDYVKTNELPKVKLVSLPPAPPSFTPHHKRIKNEYYIKNGDAVNAIRENDEIACQSFNPRDSILHVNTHAGIAYTERIGTRIIPLKDVAADDEYSCGAYSRMIENRRNGIASAIGKDFLMESDELPQGEVSVYAKGF